MAGALNPIQDFVMNGTEIVNAPAMPVMGKLSGHVLCLIGTAPMKAEGTPFNEAIKVDDYAHAMKLTNSGNAYQGTLPAVLEYVLNRVDVITYIVVVDTGANDVETLANIVGGIDGSTGEATGIYCAPACAEQPTIVYAPSFSDVALGQKLCQVANQIKAFPVMDAPNTNKMEAAQYSALFGGVDSPEENFHLAFPSGLFALNNGGGTAVIPAGARLVASLAGVQMWESPQSELDSVQDNSIPVGYNPTSENSDHNFLNKHGIYTFCRSPLGGIVCTGNRAHAGKFSSKVGLQLALARKLIATSEIYKGKMITKPFAEAIVARLNSWIKTLKVDDQCIIDAKVSVNSKNTTDSYRSGSFYITLAYGDYSPLEHFQVTIAEDITIVEKYVEELKAL